MEGSRVYIHSYIHTYIRIYIDLDKAAISSGLSLSAGVPSTFNMMSPLRRPASCAGDPSSVLATTVVPRTADVVEGTNTSNSTPMPVS